MIYTLEEFAAINYFCYCGIEANVIYINRYNNSDLKHRCNKHQMKAFENMYGDYVEISENELICLRIMES